MNSEAIVKLPKGLTFGQFYGIMYSQLVDFRYLKEGNLMRALLLITLLILSLSARAELAYGPLMGYQSAEGQVRLLAFRLSGDWHDLAASREIIYQILPTEFSSDAQYLSRKGFVKLVCFRYLNDWYLADEALVVVGRIYAHEQNRL